VTDYYHGENVATAAMSPAVSADMSRPPVAGDATPRHRWEPLPISVPAGCEVADSALFLVSGLSRARRQQRARRPRRDEQSDRATAGARCCGALVRRVNLAS
jgi:hypothetical protein